MQKLLLVCFAGILMTGCITASRFKPQTKIPDGYYSINGGPYRGFLKIHQNTAVSDVFIGDKFATAHYGDTLNFEAAGSIWQGKTSKLTQKNKVYQLHTNLGRIKRDTTVYILKVSRIESGYSDSAVVSWLNADKNSAALISVEAQFFERFGVNNSTLSRIHTLKKQFGIERDKRDHASFMIALTKLKAALMAP